MFYAPAAAGTELHQGGLPKARESAAFCFSPAPPPPGINTTWYAHWHSRQRSSPGLWWAPWARMKAVWCGELLGLFLHISPIRCPARFRFTQLVPRRYTLPRSVSLLTHYRRFLPSRHLLTRPISWNVCARSADSQGSAAVHHLSAIAAHNCHVAGFCGVTVCHLRVHCTRRRRDVSYGLSCWLSRGMPSAAVHGIVRSR